MDWDGSSASASASANTMLRPRPPSPPTSPHPSTMSSIIQAGYSLRHFLLSVSDVLWSVVLLPHPHASPPSAEAFFARPTLELQVWAPLPSSPPAPILQRLAVELHPGCWQRSVPSPALSLSSKSAHRPSPHLVDSLCPEALCWVNTDSET